MNLDGVDPAMIEITQRHEALNRKAVILADENASLMNQLAQHEALQEDEEYNLQPDVVLPWKDKPSLYIHAEGWVEGGRMLLFGFVEKFGAQAPYIGLGADVIFAGLTLWLLFAWMKAEWHANSYVVIPRMILVVISIVIAANCFTQGAIWDGSFLPTEQTADHAPAPDQPAPAEAQPDADGGPGLSGTLWASALSFFFLSLAASRYAAWSMFRSQKFLDHPLSRPARSKGAFP